MQPYGFLSGLPALLGLAGFVLYQVLGANKAGDEITRRIIDKLRNAGADEIPADRRLTPKQVGRLLDQQQRLKKIVGEQDFVLLKQALSQQFTLNVLAYVLTLGFCGWSVYLFVQPAPAVQPPIAGVTNNTQISKGDKSPNIVSNGSGSVSVNIQDQSTQKPLPSAESSERKK